MMDLHNHLDLLLRFDRGLALKSAISQVIEPNRTRVLDAGCGSGLLSLWAAQFGASEVVGVDLADTSVAQKLMKVNGLEGRIRFLEADLLSIGADRIGHDFDVIFAMLYVNDPRRDEFTSRLATDIHKRFLAKGGKVLPNRIEYGVIACDWPTQDIRSLFRSIRSQQLSLEERYGLAFDPLVQEAMRRPNPHWFPKRQPCGRLERDNARLLNSETTFAVVDYTKGFCGYPDELLLDIDASGVFTSLIWIQRIYFDECLIFLNESVSWISEPPRVEPGSRFKLLVDDVWRRSNILRAERL